MPGRPRLQGARRAAADQARRRTGVRGRAPGDREVEVDFDVAVLGGGAAGLFCAAEAARRGRRVVVLERESRVGRKIEISGGGRCNFTNRLTRAEDFLSANLDFARSALARFTAEDFIARVDARGIAWHEKKAGQLFCDGSARQIVALLVDDCRAAGVEIRTGCAVGAIEQGDAFVVATERGPLRAAALVVASGGLSIPKIGATDLAYRVAERFGIAVVPPRPGLVPLSFGDTDRAAWSDLSGISFPALVTSGGARARESVLFTHRGLSGPAILDASSTWSPEAAIEIDLLPEPAQERSLLSAAERSAELANVLAGILPRRLATRWCEQKAPSRPLRRFTPRELQAVVAELHRWTIVPAGTEGYAKAEVTVGGVDTRELSSKTMEARRMPGLYFIGEGVDVTGRLGGFNFQWAWSSGFAAGRAI